MGDYIFLLVWGVWEVVGCKTMAQKCNRIEENIRHSG